MSGDRYVVLGLAHVRSGWSTEVMRWATTGSLPIEFVKCVSVEELRARLAGGRLFSAALLDARLHAVDRDLVSILGATGVPAIVVATAGRDGAAFGAAADLDEAFDRSALLDVLNEHAVAVDSVSVEPPSPGPLDDAGSATWRARVVVVTGGAGMGTSTVAAALAQRTAEDPRQAGDVLLVDLCRRARQGLLHDARDLVPGLQELVEAHRTGRPPPDQVGAHWFDVPTRGYRLLLGLRRPRDWVGLRPRALDAALDSIAATARTVVADVDEDLDGEAETGSSGIEDRNRLTRSAVAMADAVVVVATPTLAGLHSLVGQLGELRDHGVPGDRVVVVLNRAPRAARARAELTRAVADLTGAADRPDPYVGPVFVPERRGLDSVHRDLARFPAVVADPAAVAVQELLDRLGRRDGDRATGAEEPVPIRPGELGHWADLDDLPDQETGS